MHRSPRSISSNGQMLLPETEVATTFRQTVETPEITFVGDGQADIIDPPAQRVDEEITGWCLILHSELHPLYTVLRDTSRMHSGRR